MKIQIEYIKSTTEKIIYRFTIDNNFNFNYTGILYSYRNDENDIWGDQWEDYYGITCVAEQLAFEDKHDYYPGSWDYNPLDAEYTAIAEKYNPVLHKTKFGKPYLSGAYGGKLPKFEIPEKEIIKKLKLVIKEKLKKSKIIQLTYAEPKVL
jgi:hypothetical protein